MKKHRILYLLIILVTLACSFVPALAEESSSILVVVFSHAGENWQVGVIDEGNTMKMARIIAELLNADLFEIVPEIPYPVDYEEMKDVAQQELDLNARPAYTGDADRWEDYETVFVGYPIWWGGMPKIVEHFLEQHDFAGKTVIPFNTHGGSGQAGTQSVFESRLTEANVLKGLAIPGTQAQRDSEKTQKNVQNWLIALGLMK